MVKRYFNKNDTMKDHQLNKWDKVHFPEHICEYIKTDCMYSKWKVYRDWELINDWATFSIRDELEKQWDYYVIKK